MQSSFGRNLVLLSAMVAWAAGSRAQGPLLPPGAPAPSMRTLEQVEPRTPVESLPGNDLFLHVIEAPGAYYLTGNLTGVNGKGGIGITTSSVTVDLRGFTVAGVEGATYGIQSSDLQATGIHVINGIIRDWPFLGLQLRGRGNRVQGISVISNPGGGMFIGPAAAVLDCTAVQNGQLAYFIGEGSVISRCTAQLNTSGTAFSISRGGAVSDCTAVSNAGGGFGASSGDVTFFNSNSRGNGGYGFSLADSSSIQHCTSVNNGADGIVALGNCLILNNTVSGNGQTATGSAGIRVNGANNRIDGNNVLNHSRALTDVGIQVSAAGNLVVRNSASNNTANFSITGVNTVDPVITATGTITSTNPWANFEF
jgi:hypothetical protein